MHPDPLSERARRPDPAAAAGSPLVSIGVPVFNGAAFLATALDSLRAQTYDNLEIVIVDNGSTDDTARIGRDYARRDPRIRYVRFEGTIPTVPNYRRALALATGRYFTWNAADDVRGPTVVADGVEALERSPAAVAVHGPVVADLVREGRLALVPNEMCLRSPDPAARVTAFTRGVSHCGILYALYRREALTEVFFPAHCGQDYLVLLQTCLLGEVEYIRTPLITYRHVWGEIETPMYARQPCTLRDLLVYRGVRRKKCWVTLLAGVLYLLRMRRVPPGARRAAAAAHVRAFVRRYRRELASELPFLACQPMAWAGAPFVPVARRAKRHWLGRRKALA